MALSDFDTAMVLTGRSPERIVRERGSRSWRIDVDKWRHAQWLVCTQNQKADHLGPTEPHRSGFLVGRISGIIPAPDDPGRWHFAISEYARIAMPELWDYGHYPVRHTSLAALGIDPATLHFQPIDQAPTATERDFSAVMAQARMLISQGTGVRPEAVRIAIEG
jgi:hypothetical protein